MRNLICVILVVFLPLTLASQTQNRFKVAVLIAGDDAHITSVLESHLKRELRLLGDVDIVEAAEQSWHFLLMVNYFEIEYDDGRKTGDVALASIFYERIPDFHFKTHWLANLRKVPVYPDGPSVAHYPKDRLDKYCVSTIGRIDKNDLAPVRKLLR